MSIVGAVLMIMWRMLEFTFKLLWGFVSLIFDLIGRSLGGVQNETGIFRIDWKNRANRGVKTYRRSIPVSGLLEQLPPSGKLVISGGEDAEMPSWRNVLTAQAVAKAARSGRGVVVLHKGNGDLTARLQAAVESSRLVIVDKDNRIYDPLCGYGREDCIHILTDALKSDRDAFDAATEYLDGLFLAVKYCRKKQPSLYMLNHLAGLTLEKVQEQLDKCLNLGKISQAEYDEVKSLLMSGLSGRAFLKSELNTIYNQMNNLTVDSAGFPTDQLVNIGRAFREGLVLVVDLAGVSSIGYKGCYGMLITELSTALGESGKGYLALDNLPVAESPLMLEKLSGTQTGLGISVAAQDLYACCKSDKNKFSDLLGGCSACVVFRHEGSSAKAWEEHFNTYQKLDVSQTRGEGTMKPSPFVLCSGRNKNKGYTVTEKKDFKVPEDQIAGLADGVMFARAPGLKGIVHAGLKEE